MCQAPDKYCISSVSKMIADGFLDSTRLNDIGDTFLIQALKNNDLELVRFLVQMNFDVNAPDSSGHTPLEVMIQENNVDMVIELLNLGADVNIESCYYTKDKYSILHIALKLYQFTGLSLIKALLEHGADLTVGKIFKSLNPRGVGYKSCVNLILEYGVRLTDATQRMKLCKKYFTFCKAIINENIELIEEMIMEISDIDFKKVDDLPLSFVCAYFNKPRILELLIDYGADLSLEEYAIFQIPVTVDCIEIAEVLIKSNFLLLSRKLKKNMITLAIGNGHIEIIELLFKYNVPSRINKMHYTILHLASDACANAFEIIENHKQIFERLIKADICDINAQTKKGETALNLLTLNMQNMEPEDTNCCELITMFLEYGADSEIPNSTGICPDHEQCDFENCNVDTYFKKVFLLDENYTNLRSLNLIGFVIDSACFEIDTLEIYQRELTDMKSLKISHRTVANPSLSVFEFLFLDPTMTARYVINRMLNNIYKEYHEDFKNRFPNYGFALNYQFKKGSQRHDLMKSAQDLLVHAWAADVPQEITDYIFQYMSNGKIKSFLKAGIY